MKTRKLVLLTTSLGVCSIAVALAVTANHMYSGAFGLGLQNAPANATSKTFTLNLGTEHTFDSNNKATEYAINENANNYGVEFLLTKVSNESDAMSVVNGRTQVRQGDTIENVNALSGVTSITVNGGNGNFRLFAGYDKSAMFEFLMSESNGGTRIYNNIPNCNYFRFVGKYDNYDCLISSIEFTYSATGSTCNYGQGVEASDITVKKGTYNKYVGGAVQHEIVVESNAILVDDNLFSFARIEYDGKYLYSQTADQTLLVSYSGNDLVVVKPTDTTNNINGTYVIAQEATAVTMSVNGSVVAENDSANRMNVTVGDSFTFSATSDAVPAETVSIEFVDETGTTPDPFVGTYTLRSTLTVSDAMYVWNEGEQFELPVDPIVVTKSGTSYQVQYSDHGYGDYAGMSGTYDGYVNGQKLKFDDPNGNLECILDLESNELSFTYTDDDEGVILMGDGRFDFVGEGGATAKFENGVVTVLEEGDFHLIATAANGVSATLYVHTDAYVAATVSVYESAKTLEIDETYQIVATVNADATNKALTYASNKTSVATVSATGLVTAKSAGSATITVTTADGNSATVAITVNAPASVSYTFEDLAGNIFDVEIIEGVSIRLSDGYLNCLFNYNATDHLYHYVSDDNCTLEITEVGESKYLDICDPNCTLFGYGYIMLDSVDSVLLK